MRTKLDAATHRHRIMLENNTNLRFDLWFMLQRSQEAENELHRVDEQAKGVEEKANEAEERAKETKRKS